MRVLRECPARRRDECEGGQEDDTASLACHGLLVRLWRCEGGGGVVPRKRASGKTAALTASAGVRVSARRACLVQMASCLLQRVRLASVGRASSGKAKPRLARGGDFWSRGERITSLDDGEDEES